MFAASLPMYSIPEIRDAQTAFWKGIARHLGKEGISDLPPDLAFDENLADLLGDPGMILGQSCGYDVVCRYRDTLVPVGTPRFNAPGFLGHEYSSLIVVGQDSAFQDVLEMRGTRAVANGPESHSGMSALRHLVAPLNKDGVFFGSVKYSGAHEESLRAIREGRADVAAIDCVTHALFARYRPVALESTRVIGRTFYAPAPPFVTHVSRGDETIARVKAALRKAFSDPSLAACREDLLLDGIDDLDRSDYAKVLDFESYAIKLGYPELR